MTAEQYARIESTLWSVLERLDVVAVRVRTLDYATAEAELIAATREVSDLRAGLVT